MSHTAASPSPDFTLEQTDLEIVAKRVFDAPRDLVWKAWTDPKHLAQWFGPKGFTVSTFAHDLRAGGVWRFVLHGPDGTDFQNKVTFLEIVPGEKLTYTQGGDVDVEPVKFSVTVLFTSVGETRTRVDMRMTFESAKMKAYVCDHYGAIQGLRDTLGRLSDHLPRADDAEVEFVLSRAFAAPRPLVFDAWTDREHLSRWFGPVGMPIAASSLELTPGGMYHYSMALANGQTMWGRWVFREIVRPQRVVFVQSFSDADRGVVRSPFSATWPLETLSTLTFAEYEGKTVVTLRALPLNATAEERATFKQFHASMQQGWGGTLGQLATYLE